MPSTSMNFNTILGLETKLPLKLLNILNTIILFYFV